MTTRRVDYPLENDPLWYKSGIIYQVHVRTFHDSDGDGIGDFPGLTQKLDYLQDLGVTAIWLLPFYPSPLRDDGYDTADYRSINPMYGTMADFRHFLDQAHRRGLRVITELVINHTSDQHSWFQRARRAKPGSRYHDYYVWSDTGTEYADTRIIFKDFEASNWSWDPVAKRYYWHRFYHHQPDLNFDNPAVRREVLRLVDYWFGMGVDGMRLDAIPYLYEREGTNCENLPETHVFLRELRAHVDAHHPNRMLLAEANQWPEDAVRYFGDGDECHMAFHFPVMPRLFMAIQMEDRFPIVDILRQTPQIHETSQWAMFLRNHDELTLEMVTDEERDYMYRVYAADPQARINLGIRRRLAPLLGNDTRRIQLMNALLFSMPGTPIVYYGDEIGMGDNVYLGDRNGVRTPMQWSADRNAGFSRANPQKLYSPVVIDPSFHYEAINADAQQNNPNGLLWWMKRLIAVTKQHQVFGRGTLEILSSDNPKVLTLLRQYEGESIVVVANLSRYAQAVHLDLPAYAGSSVVELFGQTNFPSVTDAPYMITVGPHDFYWLALGPAGHAEDVREPAGMVPSLAVRGRWDAILRPRGRHALASVLLGYIRGRRWYGGKARRILSAEILDAVPLTVDDERFYLTFLRVTYREGEPETYSLFLGFAEGDAAAEIRHQYPGAVVATLALSRPVNEGILFDAIVDGECQTSLLDAMTQWRSFRSGTSELFATRTRAFAALRGSTSSRLEPKLLGVDQSNTSVLYGDRMILKLFRRPGTGLNPDLEIGRFLTERAAFPHTAPVAGALEYRARRGAEPTTIAIMHGFVENQGDAWRYTLDELGRFFERAMAHPENGAPDLPVGGLLDLQPDDMPELVEETMGSYAVWAALLGQRTAELHLALGSSATDPAFAPEPFTLMYQRSLYAALRGQASQAVQLLGQRRRDLPSDVQADAQRVVALESAMHQRFERLRGRRMSGMRTRTHGDYHLGQVLNTGRDFVIIDFEGEPARPITERRLKRSPLRDVAGMIRSFDYAAQTELRARETMLARPEDVRIMERWASLWTTWSSAAYLRAYLETMGDSNLIPEDDESIGVLVDAYLLEKAAYEIAYELNNRPDWLRVPLRGILRLLQQ